MVRPARKSTSAQQSIPVQMSGIRHVTLSGRATGTEALGQSEKKNQSMVNIYPYQVIDLFKIHEISQI